MRASILSKITLFLLCMVLAVSCTPVENRAGEEQELATSKAEEQKVVASKQEVAEGAPDIKFDSTEFQFGEVDKGTKVEARYEFTNVGTADLKILAVKPTCGCTVSEYTKKPIPPKGKGFVTGVLDTNRAGPNPVSRTIRVTTNDPDQKMITLYIKGHVITDIDVPRVISFGAVDYGKEASKTANVTIYKKELEITEVKSSSPYVKASFKPAEQNAKTKKYRIDATLSKDAPVGKITGRLSIVVKGKDSPLAVVIAGTVRGEVYAPSQLRFARFTQGEQKFRVASIRKTKQPYDLKIIGVKNESEFVTTELKETRPGQLYSLRVELKPTAPVGQLTDTITIDTNNAQIPSLKIYVHAQILASQHKAK